MHAEINRLFNDIWFLIFFVLLIASFFTYIISKWNKTLNFFAKLDKKSNIKIVWIGIIIYIIFFGTTSIMQHYALNTHAEDLGMFTQVVWNSLHGNMAYTTLKHECFFKEHFAPIYLVISPLYLLFNSPVVLLVIQTIMLALIALPIYYISDLKLKSPFAALALSLSYLFCPHIHCANLFDFHQEILEGFLILSAFYLILKYDVKRKLIFACILLGLAFLCKEDVAFNVIPLALLLIFKEKKKIGIPILIVSIIYFIVTTNFIIPLYNTPAERHVFFAVRYGWLGASPFEIMKNGILHPLNVAEYLFSIDKIAIILRLLLPVAFLNIIGFWGGILFVLPLLANLLSSFRPQYTLSAHYAVVIIPFVYLGAIYGMDKLLNGRKQLKDSSKLKLCVFIIIAGIFAAFAFAPHTFNMRKCKITPHKKIFYKLKEQVPSDAVLSTQVDLLPHLAHRKKVYLFPEILDAEYVLIDIKGNIWPCDNYDVYMDAVNKLNNDKRFEKILEQDGYFIHKKVTETFRSP